MYFFLDVYTRNRPSLNIHIENIIGNCYGSMCAGNSRRHVDRSLSITFLHVNNKILCSFSVNV